MQKFKKSGFTLIEVIIAIAIIGILFAAFSRLGNFGGAIGKAKDAQVQSVVAQIKNAVNIEYLTSGSFPNAGDMVTVLKENDIQLPEEDSICIFYGYNPSNGQFFVSGNGSNAWIVARTVDGYEQTGTANCASPPNASGYTIETLKSGSDA